MSLSSPAGRRYQSRGEEITNSLSHGLALLAALIAAPFLVVYAVAQGDPTFVVAASIFAATVVLLYLASTIYHALPRGRVKQVFQAVDHSAIFLLIAGTYTPFTLGVLRGPWGWTLFGIIWGLAAIGVLMKSLGKIGHPAVSAMLYISMGWLVVIAINPLLAHLPVDGLLWLLGGGLAYTAGVIFFVLDARLPYGHFVWHLFVIAGTTCHYLAVFLYAA